jgi:MFS family permease
LFTAFYGPIQVLLGKQAELLAPEDKELALGVVVGLGAAFAVVANPLFGALSDRTTWRLGRRLPWTAIGALGGAVSLGILALAPNIAVMALGWCAAQLSLNAMFAALVAAVPDQVPTRQRGMVGGWLGVGQTLGIVVGSGLAAAVGGLAAGYLVCAAFLLIATVPYLLLRRDTALDPAQRPPWRLRGFWISPRLHPDFGWAWLTRFLMNLGNAIAIVYLLYFLQDEVRYADPDNGVFVLTAVYAVTLLSTVVVGGIWSDRAGRRKVFVSGAGLVMAFAALLLAFWPTWPGALVAAAVLGLGFGVYQSVDFALMTEVLPSEADRGRDLGVVNIANTLPQVLAPVLAAPVVTHLGGYPVLYVLAAISGAAGAVLVYRIRSVR